MWSTLICFWAISFRGSKSTGIQILIYVFFRYIKSQVRHSVSWTDVQLCPNSFLVYFNYHLLTYTYLTYIVNFVLNSLTKEVILASWCQKWKLVKVWGDKNAKSVTKNLTKCLWRSIIPQFIIVSPANNTNVKFVIKFLKPITFWRNISMLHMTIKIK